MVTHPGLCEHEAMVDLTAGAAAAAVGGIGAGILAVIWLAIIIRGRISGS